jgi:hypothetical protein
VLAYGLFSLNKRLENSKAQTNQTFEIQNKNVVIKIGARTASHIFSDGTPIHQRPNTADIPIQIVLNTAKNHSKTPPGFAAQANPNCPRTKCDQLVVIPHVGQRIPNNNTEEQGGNPSCW